MELPRVALVLDEAFARLTGKHFVVEQFLLCRDMVFVELRTPEGSSEEDTWTCSLKLSKKLGLGEDVHKQ